jgi:hypothetical protein
MKIPAQCFILGFAALLCFLDAFLAPKGAEAGPGLTAVMGILLVRRAIIITPQSAIVIVAGCALAGFVVVANHNLLNVNKPIWIGLTVIAFVCYGLWERIEKLWK